MINRRGVSPVVATILLIAITVVLAVIVFLWARGFIDESAEKRGEPVERACEDVDFVAGLFKDGVLKLDIVNHGNIPIYGVELKKYGQDTILPSQYLDGTITAGESATITLDSDFVSTLEVGDSILVVPIILGQTQEGKVAHACDDAAGYSAPVTVL